jgi:hypothetical protein
MLRELLKESDLQSCIGILLTGLTYILEVGNVKSWPAIAVHLSTLQIYLKKKKGKKFLKISPIQDKYVLMDEFQILKCW